MTASKTPWIFRLIIISLFTFFNIGALKAQPNQSISYDEFYDALEPYGDWVNDSQDGYVWIPNVERNFKPYATKGHWIMTDYGNTWVSDYGWGWAPFHYGRWRDTDRYGWVWVPGEEWAPAWVSWRSGNGYYGWAALSPDDDMYADNSISSNAWVFVREAYIGNAYLSDYYEPRSRMKIVFRNSSFLNNIYSYNNRVYVCGPRRIDIERATRSRVVVYRVNNYDRPGCAAYRNGYVDMYRPNIRHNYPERDDNRTWTNQSDQRNSNWNRDRDNNENRPGNNSSYGNDNREDQRQRRDNQNDNREDQRQNRDDQNNRQNQNQDNGDNNRNREQNTRDENERNRNTRPDRSGVRNPTEERIAEIRNATRNSGDDQSAPNNTNPGRPSRNTSAPNKEVTQPPQQERTNDVVRNERSEDQGRRNETSEPKSARNTRPMRNGQ